MSRFACTLAAWSCLASLAVAADSPASAEKTGDDKSAQIARWVADLGSEEYAVRKRATENLVDAGAAAADAVAKAADTDDLELPRRCVGILQEMRHADDAKTQEAAKAALKKLTESDRKFLAEIAAKALKAPAPEAGPVGPAGGVRIQIGGGVVIRGGQNVRISSKVVNGQKDVTVEIGPKKIHITDDNGRNIVVQVTDEVKDADGNLVPQTKEYKADDLDDLKQKHPEAAKIYQQYGGAGGAIRIGGFGNAGVAPPKPRLHVDVLKRQLESIEKMIERYEDRVDAGQIPEEHFERLHKTLDAHKQHLQKQIEELERAAKVEK